MLSTVADLTSLAQLAPWLAVGVVCLVAAAWVYRQSRRGIAKAEERALLSAQRQGERLGRLEHKVELLNLRRRMTEEDLADEGIRLSYWPPDGPDQPRPRRDVRNFSTAAEDDDAPATRVPVPPLPPTIGAHHRRDTA